MSLALALVAKKPCPICDALVWKSTDTTVDLPLARTEFLCSYLNRKASELNSEGNGH